jgi:hypothetical protein
MRMIRYVCMDQMLQAPGVAAGSFFLHVAILTVNSRIEIDT